MLYLQQVAGYSAIEAGTTTLPVTAMMFLLSSRFGALADRHGPRFFMGVGPLVAAAGLAWFLRIDADVDYVTDLLPGLVVFALGLSMTVAPLTATVLADADESNAGIASGTNNAIARVASLIAIAAVGALVSSSYADSLRADLGPAASRPAVSRAIDKAEQQPLTRVVVTGVPPGVQRSAGARRRSTRRSTRSTWRSGSRRHSWRWAALLGLAGIVNPRREVHASDCPGGQLVGATVEAARAA